MFEFSRLAKGVDLGYNVGASEAWKMEEKRCLLNEGRICVDCGECARCDLDPDKLCDNCMKCVRSGADYTAVEVDEVFETEEIPRDD